MPAPWDPYTQTNIQKLEMVQWRAARYVTSRHRNTSSISNMLQSLNWRSLETRRKDACLCMMFKIERELVAIGKEGRLLSPKRHGTRHRHSRAYQPISSRIGRLKMSFFPKTVRDGMLYLRRSLNWKHWKPSRLKCPARHTSQAAELCF